MRCSGCCPDEIICHQITVNKYFHFLCMCHWRYSSDGETGTFPYKICIGFFESDVELGGDTVYIKLILPTDQKKKRAISAFEN